MGSTTSGAFLGDESARGRHDAPMAGVERTVTGFAVDEQGDWVAELSCGHRQHVRHRPPWELRPWVLTEEGRKARLGVVLVCMKCNPVDPSSEAERASEKRTSGQ